MITNFTATDMEAKMFYIIVPWQQPFPSLNLDLFLRHYESSFSQMHSSFIDTLLGKRPFEHIGRYVGRYVCM